MCACEFATKEPGLDPPRKVCLQRKRLEQLYQEKSFEMVALEQQLAGSQADGVRSSLQQVRAAAAAPEHRPGFALWLGCTRTHA